MFSSRPACPIAAKSLPSASLVAAVCMICLVTAECSVAQQPPRTAGPVLVSDDHPFAELFAPDPSPAPADRSFVAQASPALVVDLQSQAADPLQETDQSQEVDQTQEVNESRQVDPTQHAAAADLMVDQPLPRLGTDAGYAVLLAGPVHEALLARYELPVQPAPQTLVAQAPPAEIDEAPAVPTSSVPRFVGNRVQWISGYWSWLPHSHEYVWVSGLYRDVPPGRKWQPGSWQQTPEGYIRHAGYWADTSPDAVADMPQGALPPLATEDQLPPQAPPSADSFWIPGQWLIADAANPATVPQSAELSSDGNLPDAPYRWRPGYWAVRAEDWIWQPDHYVRTPEGYVFVSGYWDYEPHYRGQAYAAVVFDNAIGATPAARSFRPSYPLSRPAATLLHLFVQDDCRQYYYGDFYEDAFAQLGYRPWYRADNLGQPRLTSPSPLLSYYHWKYRRKGIDFGSSMERFAQHFRSAPSIRPAAQLSASPQLAIREGLAGAVFANTFDAIVSGVVGGRPAVPIAAGNVRFAASPLNDRAWAGGQSVADSPLPVATAWPTAAAFSPLPKAAPLGLPGTSGLMVLPGGKVIAAPHVAMPAVSPEYPPTLELVTQPTLSAEAGGSALEPR